MLPTLSSKFAARPISQDHLVGAWRCCCHTLGCTGCHGTHPMPPRLLLPSQARRDDKGLQPQMLQALAQRDETKREKASVGECVCERQPRRKGSESRNWSAGPTALRQSQDPPPRPAVRRGSAQRQPQRNAAKSSILASPPPPPPSQLSFRRPSVLLFLSGSFLHWHSVWLRCYNNKNVGRHH